MVGAKQFAMLRKIIEAKEQNPISKPVILPKAAQVEASFNTLSGSFLDRFHKEPQKAKAVERKSKDTPESYISEELINLVTYKVLQNVKSYFENRKNTKSDNTKRIQIAIDL